MKKMALAGTNRTELCGRLDEFRLGGRFTDVTIKCEGKAFQCHRAILAASCEYFERMFELKCKESISSVLDLGDNMQAAIVEEVMKFLYTGDAQVTPHNIVDLLVASDYFGLPALETLCLQAVLGSGFEPMTDLLDLLLFAHATSKSTVMNVLESCNMTKCLKQFFQTDDFLDIPVELFVLVITKLWKSPSNDALIGSIHKWISHAAADRMRHAETLVKLMDRTKISARFKSSLDEWTGEGNQSAKNGEAREISHVFTSSSPQPSMFVYVENGYSQKIFSINPTGSVGLPFYGPPSAIGDFRCVFAPNQGLYQFNYVDRHTSWFHLSAPVNLLYADSDVPLAPPPIYPYAIDVCTWRERGLYLLHRFASTHVKMRTPASIQTRKRQLSNAEKKRGIFFYNFELDDWFAVPAMRERHESCLSIVDDLVYVVGGIGSAGFTQAYDHREGFWRIIPPTSYRHFKPQACVLDGHIYVGSGKTPYFERYHPRAGKWEPIVKMRAFNDIQRLVPYSGNVWALNTDMSKYFECFNPHMCSWTTLLLRTTDHFSSPHLASGRVLDSVVCSLT